MAIRGWSRALAGSCAWSLCVFSGCSLVLDFDEPIGSFDAGAEDASVIQDPDADLSPDAATAANCAVLEPNDTLATPMAITPTTIEAALCPSTEQDFYSFVLLANSELTITLNFLDTPIAGDLNLRLYDSADTVVSVANGTGTSDQIVHSPNLANALPAGTYRIEVFPATLNADKDYSLTLAQVVVP